LDAALAPSLTSLPSTTLPLPRACRQRSFELDVNEKDGMRERMSF